MTQEELDALMSGDINLDEETQTSQEDDSDKTVENDSKYAEDENYRVEADVSWPPPPPTPNHKMVQQLDSVTKDSEAKATEMLDKLDEIYAFLVEIESISNESLDAIKANVALFDKLSTKFPKVSAFKTSLTKNQKIIDDFSQAIEKIQSSEDEIMNIMDMMQYQDIHRQKIERVINVMRALSRYMSSLFESSVDDNHRVSSAVHIEGDKKTEQLMSDADIEALINSLGKK